jgi:hypothetical protein
LLQGKILASGSTDFNERCLLNVKTHYIITTVKHAIWLVNSRAGSGYPAREIKMPARDFRGILKMSLFHCSYFIKQLPNGFPSKIAWSNALACGSSIFTLSESLATSLVHGHAILHGKPFGIPLLLQNLGMFPEIFFRIYIFADIFTDIFYVR